MEIKLETITFELMNTPSVVSGDQQSHLHLDKPATKAK
jgi:hypothetical protein